MVWRQIAQVSLLTLTAVSAQDGRIDLGDGFVDHGVAVPISNHRGTVATVDGEGRNVVLAWLYDHRGGYELLLVDATTGKYEEFPMPFPPGGEGPFASLLSSRNRFYTQFNGHFCEFDPVRREFTLSKAVARGMAMGMTEDDHGVIWSVTYPNSGVVAFDPASGELTDHGYVHTEKWPQYQRSVAVDAHGWVYFAVGNTASEIVAFDPRTRTARALLEDDERQTGTAFVYRDRDGHVYGQALQGRSTWVVLRDGQREPLDGTPPNQPMPVVTGSQTLFHPRFPDGDQLRSLDLVERRITLLDAETGEVRTHAIDYDSDGAHIMGVIASPDGAICGGTAFPMRLFRHEVDTDARSDVACFGQWNTMATQGDQVLVGGYPGGFLLRWDPVRDWVPTARGRSECNPQFLRECSPAIHRPHDLLPLPDGDTVVLAGTPGYGYTGGGLLFWHRASGESVLVEHEDLLPWQSTYALAALADGTVVGGTTVSPGTGGERKAERAELYLLDPESRQITWHEAVIEGASTYTDLCLGPRGLVYGFADRKTFFVFDPERREIVHRDDAASRVGPSGWQQGPRVFVQSPEGVTFVLFERGVARVDEATFAIDMLANSPVPIGAGGAWLANRIWFASGSHLYSWTDVTGSTRPDASAPAHRRD